jgi:hypothetical protein
MVDMQDSRLSMAIYGHIVPHIMAVWKPLDRPNLHPAHDDAPLPSRRWERGVGLISRGASDAGGIQRPPAGTPAAGSARPRGA